MDANERRAQEAGGRWLREQRTRRGYDTVGKFARALGVDPSRISQYERGLSAISDKRAEQIAEVLEMDLIEVRRNLRLWTPGEAEMRRHLGLPAASEDETGRRGGSERTRELVELIDELQQKMAEARQLVDENAGAERQEVADNDRADAG